jgi:hypothetical protein
MFKGLKSGVTCNNNRFITPNRNFYLEKKYLWLHETTNKKIILLHQQSAWKEIKNKNSNDLILVMNAVWLESKLGR